MKLLHICGSLPAFAISLAIMWIGGGAGIPLAPVQAQQNAGQEPLVQKVKVSIERAIKFCANRKMAGETGKSMENPPQEKADGPRWPCLLC